MRSEEALNLQEEAAKRKLEIRRRKAHDYATDEDCLSNFKMMAELAAVYERHGAPIDVATPHGVAMWHLLHKVTRILNLWVKGEEAECESLEDSHDDLENYSELAKECYIDWKPNHPSLFTFDGRPAGIQNLDAPEYVEKTHERWATKISKHFKRGDVVMIHWNDAADERQVVKIKAEKVPTPVWSLGLFYDVVVLHLIVVEHVFAGRYKDVTYIPVGIVDKIIKIQEVDGLMVEAMGQIMKEKSWSSHAHTRKVRIGKRGRALKRKRVEPLLKMMEDRGILGGEK